RSVTYTNSSDNPSGSTRTISFQVDDGAAANHASNVPTTTVSVTPVNDAPINTVPTTQVTTTNTHVTSSSDSGTPLPSSDVDASGGTEHVTFAVPGGRLSLAALTGLAGVAGNGTILIIISGSLTNTNSDLDGLVFPPAPPTFVGAD